MNNIAVIQRVTLALLNSDFLVWDNVLRFDYKGVRLKGNIPRRKTVHW